MKKIIMGVETHYEKIGNKGPVLLMLHGWANTWESWSSVIGPLSQKYQLVLPDLPSFGSSSEPKKVWSSQEFAQWLDRFVKEVLMGHSFILLGHSFGGKIACVYASKYAPLHLLHLVVVDASGLPDRLSPVLIFQKKMLSLIPHTLKTLIPIPVKRRLLGATNSSTDYMNATPYQKSVLKQVLSENIATELQKLSLPTTIIWGDHDTQTPIHQAHSFHNHIRNSTLHTLATGHFPFIEKPSEFIQILSDQLPSKTK